MPAAEPPLLALIRQKAAEESGFVASEAVQDPDTRLRKALSDAITASGRTRAQVADDLTESVGRRVSEPTINAWLADSKEGHRFPAAYLPAFCRAVGSLEPLVILASAAGGHVVDTTTLLLAERARADRDAAEARRRAKLLDRALGGTP